MSFQVAGHQTEGYQVATEVYAGPLDLLLELIERAELDITTLALAQVTDQYLAYLARCRNVMQPRFPLPGDRRPPGADQIAALLPRQPSTMPGMPKRIREALARMLTCTERFKELAGYLWQRENAGLADTFTAAPPPKTASHIKLDLSGITLEDFLGRCPWRFS